MYMYTSIYMWMYSTCNTQWGQWTWAVRNMHTTCTCVAIAASKIHISGRKL